MNLTNQDQKFLRALKISPLDIPALAAKERAKWEECAKGGDGLEQTIAILRREVEDANESALHFMAIAQEFEQERNAAMTTIRAQQEKIKTLRNFTFRQECMWFGLGCVSAYVTVAMGYALGILYWGTK